MTSQSVSSGGSKRSLVIILAVIAVLALILTVTVTTSAVRNAKW